jgi:hypothetical protein
VNLWTTAAACTAQTPGLAPFATNLRSRADFRLETTVVGSDALASAANVPGGRAIARTEYAPSSAKPLYHLILANAEKQLAMQKISKIVPPEAWYALEVNARIVRRRRLLDAADGG